MEKVINLLNDIETKAEKILSRVSDDKARLNEEMSQKMKSFDSNVQIETDKKLANLRKKTENEVKLELSRIQKEQEEYLEHLNEYFDANCEQYVDEIFNRIIAL